MDFTDFPKLFFHRNRLRNTFDLHAHAFPPRAPPTMMFRDMKPELMALNEKWGAEIKAVKAPKGTPGAPWPVKVLRTIQQPEEANAWDVYELKVLLVVEGPELTDPPLSVEFPQVDLPAKVRAAAAAMVQEHWRAAVAAGTGSTPWCLEGAFAWCEANFVALLRAYGNGTVDSYLGTTPDGLTSIRRFTIVPPKDDEKEDDEKSEDEADLTPEQLEKLQIVAEKRKEQDRLRRIRDARKAEEAEIEAERKKLEAMDRRYV